MNRWLTIVILVFAAVGCERPDQSGKPPRTAQNSSLQRDLHGSPAANLRPAVPEQRKSPAMAHSNDDLGYEALRSLIQQFDNSKGAPHHVD